KLMLDVFSQVAYPRVCRLVLAGKSALVDFFRKSYLPFLGLVTFCTAIIFLFSPQLTRFFIGTEYAYSSFLLRLLCGATIIVCLNIPAQLILLAGDHKKSYLKIFTIGTGLNVLANFLLA